MNPNETEAETFARHKGLEDDCAAEFRRREAERKRIARKHASDETKKRDSQRNVEYMRNARKHASAETKKRDAQHDAERKRNARKHASDETKKRDAQRKRDDRRHQSELKKQHEAKRKRDAYHESEETEQRQAARKRTFRRIKKSNASTNDAGPVEIEGEKAAAENEPIDIPDIPDILADINIDRATQDALKYLLRTKNEDGTHRMPVCVVCDHFIYGIEEVKSLSKNLLLKNKDRLSCKEFESIFRRQLSPSLVRQYQVEDEELHGLLLSPRSVCTSDAYQACPSCYRALTGSKNQKRKTPPVKLIANGNIFGQVPSDVIQPHHLTEVLGASLSLHRPYGCLYTWSGGKHTAVHGNHSFFDTDQSHIGGVINQFNSANANAHIKCVIAGRMTPSQKKIAQARATIQPAHYLTMLRFLKEEHPGYSEVTLPTEAHCSEEDWQPQLITDKANSANVDEEGDKGIESTVLGGTYVFSSAHDPQQDSGVFDNSSDFICALLKRDDPTMMIYGGNYTSGKALDLGLVFPLLFPYGFGSPKMDRRVPMSLEQCLKTYMLVSIPHFRQAQFILVCLHLLNRKLSYKSGNMICKLTAGDGSMNIAEKLSTLTPDELNEAAQRRAQNLPRNSPADVILKNCDFVQTNRSVECSCKGCSQEVPCPVRSLYSWLNFLQHNAM